MVVVAACLGASRKRSGSALVGGLDWDELVVTIQRGVVHGSLGETKTEVSEKPMPLDPDLAKDIP